MQLLGTDPFYALIELFQFAANAEGLFLATIDPKISAETGYDSVNQQQSTLSNHLYFQNILREHAERLRENIDTIKRRGHHSWPRVSHEDLRAKSESAAEALLKDFDYLHGWCVALIERCSTGTNIILNNAMLLESKETKKQAEELRKLTFVAFFYIPLSFTTSFFGMNFRQLGQGTLPVWIWFVVAVPLLGLSVGFLLWDHRHLLFSGKELVRRLGNVFY